MLQDLADAGAHGAAKIRTAGEDDWNDFLGVLFGFFSVFLVLALVVGKGMSRAERIGYELTDEEAGMIAAPAAKILARSWVNRRYGKHVLGAADWILMFLALSEYVERISPLIKGRIQDLPRPRAPQRAARLRPTEEQNGNVARPAPAPAWSPLSHIQPSQAT